MYRFILFLSLLLGLPLTLSAQQGNVVLIQFPGVPTGSCAPTMVALNTANGDFYNCGPAFTWLKVNGGGGGATPSGVPDNLQYNAGGGVFGPVVDGGIGQVLLGQGSGNPPIFADPTIQGI